MPAATEGLGAILITTSLIGLGGFVSADKNHPSEVVVQALEAVRVLVLAMVGGLSLVPLAGLVISWSFRLNAITHELRIQATRLASAVHAKH